MLCVSCCLFLVYLMSLHRGMLLLVYLMSEQSGMLLLVYLMSLQRVMLLLAYLMSEQSDMLLLVYLMFQQSGITVSMSAFLACHQCYCAGSSLAWGLNLRAVVRGIF